MLRAIELFFVLQYCKISLYVHYIHISVYIIYDLSKNVLSKIF